MSSHIPLYPSKVLLSRFTIEWSGINALLYYGPTLMRSLGLEGDAATLVSAGGVGIVQALAVLPVIVCIDRLGESFHLMLL